MSTTSQSRRPRLKYHPAAYEFVGLALQYTQTVRRRNSDPAETEEDEHITGQELLEGIRDLALQRFGLMTLTVLDQWGVKSTDDFGQIVFDLIERGEMRKTERDQLSDFFDVYDFEEAFDRDVDLDLSHAFRWRESG
jgi:uncharacterized repeat protein (TIGR04138 family)